jgi:myo-inositol 2-dehydrogenase / D-chiro-inositol 1-dehydrogenase
MSGTKNQFPFTRATLGTQNDMKLQAAGKSGQALNSRSGGALNRRQFLGGALTVAASARTFTGLTSLAAETAARDSKPPEFQQKIKLGVIGNGGRGAWIAKLFQKHGGYQMHAVADYFQATADKCGDELGVEKARRFSTLSGYKKLMESGVEAVALETPPYFFPEHARAAVEAGLHVYMAKPVAVDVPGALAILAAGEKAKEKGRCFLVDYQLPTEPHNVEIAKRISAGEIGKPAVVTSRYFGGGWPDPPRTATEESRFQHLVWCNDIALGGSHHVNACIHAVDAVLWVLGKRPAMASGFSQIARPNPHSDSHDVLAISYTFADGVVWDHCGRHLNNLYPFECGALIHGSTGYAQISYGGRVQLRGSDNAYSGEVIGLYEAGTARNIATFYRQITEGHFENTTVPRAVDGVLTTVLSREAAMRRVQLSVDSLLQENRRLELNLKGLKT